MLFSRLSEYWCQIYGVGITGEMEFERSIFDLEQLTAHSPLLKLS